MLSPIAWTTPPRHYGPWELFASLLTEGLVARGHTVTLFATEDSSTAARLVSTSPTGWSEDPHIEPKVAECLHIASVFERADDFDIIHNGFDFLPLTYSELVATPVVTTIHGFSSEAIVPVYERYNGSNFYVAISDANRHPRLRYAATIHHGINTRQFVVRPDADDYLLFFGRIHPDKGTAEAIEVARRTGRPLVIAGIIQDQQYFTDQIEPHVCRVVARQLGQTRLHPIDVADHRPVDVVGEPQQVGSIVGQPRPAQHVTVRPAPRRVGHHELCLVPAVAGLRSARAGAVLKNEPAKRA